MGKSVMIGKNYKHFKGMICKVLYIAKDSESLNDVVVYEHDGQVWVRDYNMFLEKVDKNKYPNVAQEYRFELVKD